MRKGARKVSNAFRLDEMAEGYVRFIEGTGCVAGHDWQSDDEDSVELYCSREGCDATRKRDFMRRETASPQEHGHVPAFARWLLS